MQSIFFIGFEVEQKEPPPLAIAKCVDFILIQYLLNFYSDSITNNILIRIQYEPHAQREDSPKPYNT